ncbi:unnamed protein product [Bursaphelenchus xylophilus]|nr:unnamed protein product [Bursaphelenchus xylophilus]CAG9081063.1 unnamed protein product [Bursaphelenchus xylophilus]
MTGGAGSEECWSKTSDYFQISLLSQLRNFVNIEIGIAQWKRQNGQEMDWEAAREDTVAKMDAELPPDIEDEDGLTDLDLYSKVIGALVKAAHEQFDKNSSRETIVECPHGCEKSSDWFFWLFCTSAMFTLFLTGGIGFMVYILDYQSCDYVDLVQETQKQKKKKQAQAPK